MIVQIAFWKEAGQALTRHRWNLLWVAGCGLLVVGCAVNRTAYRTAGIAHVTADAAMTAWGNYVKEFHPPAEAEQKVLEAFNRYKLAELALIDSAKPFGTAQYDKNAFQASVGAASAALANLVGIIQQFGVKFT